LAAPLLAVAILAALLLTVAPALAWEFVKGPPRESVVPWVFGARPGTDGPRTINISLNTGYCAGEEPPVAARPTIEELPVRAANPHPTVIITTHQILPAPYEVVGEVKPGEPAGACAGLGYGIPQRIKLKRPVKGMVFLDGSFSPPRWIPWPARRPSG
jgi:hypothetical protein